MEGGETMAFMQNDITERQEWFQADTREGVCAVPAKYFSITEIARDWGVNVDDIAVIEGFGARLSAPGYLDCTEWCVFDTENEAKAYLAEMYGDEDETA